MSGDKSQVMRSGFRLFGKRPLLTSPISSIAFRLVAVVMATGLLAFAVLGAWTAWQFNLALHEQAVALEKLSERQLADRLKSEAQLARARVEVLGSEAAARLRQLVERKDVVRAMQSRNDVVIRELFSGLTRSYGFDRLIAFDENVRVVGSDSRQGGLEMDAELLKSHLRRDAATIVTPDNRRSNPRGYVDMQLFEEPVLAALELPDRRSVGHLVIEPVFDDFGDLIGALSAIRILKSTESTLENFTTLSNAGVAILLNGAVVSGAGPTGVAFSQPSYGSNGLIRSDDGGHIGRCVAYEKVFEVCAFTNASAVTESRDQAYRIGVDQSGSLMKQMIVSAAITLAALVLALLVMVRHSTHGLSALVVAARAVASGDLNVRIKPSGVGEVHALSVAFIRMLAHLRMSMGRIRQLAFFDSVTQLPNREKSRLDAPALIGSAKAGALLFLDLDGFKSINDTFGHRSGDSLLKQVAERLTTHFSELKANKTLESVAVARVGGDEFVVIATGTEAAATVGIIAQDVIQILRRPFDLGGTRVAIGTSIGITVFPSDGTEYDELLVNADLAMYSAKKSGRNSFAFFTRDLAMKAKKRLSLESDLKAAVENEELTVYYQPKISCIDGGIRGVEALVRWKHPVSGYIRPDQFLGIAEESGIIGDIDRFVFARATSEIGSLNKAGANIGLSVNVTASEIEDPRYIRDILNILHRNEFPPTQLELEITESVAVRNAEAVLSRVASLRQTGIRLAVDDFGAGYSNLATLARLPVDTLKFDRSLVTGVMHDPEKQSIVRIALSLARELGFDSVAEGVETADDFRFVSEEGATMAQGYFFSAAVPFAELSTLIASNYLATRVGRTGSNTKPRRASPVTLVPAAGGKRN